MVDITAKLSHGERISRDVLSQWKEGDVASACIAATKLGWLSDKYLTDARCYHLLTSNLTFKKMPEERHEEIRSHFHQSRGNLMKAEVTELFLPKPANDNVSFEPSPFVWREPTVIPPRDWIYGRAVQYRS
jgi:hypothetical protein